jgi:hypothetical protein
VFVGVIVAVTVGVGVIVAVTVGVWVFAGVGVGVELGWTKKSDSSKLKA